MTNIVIAQAGSHLYGLNHPGSDHDTMGIAVMGRVEKLGLSCVEQQGKDDHVVYEITKWIRLAVNGNPTVLQMLWVPLDKTIQWDDRWPRWQEELRQLVLSERCRSAFLGYLDGQRKKLINDRGQRQDIKAQFGYDTKFAMHMVRLGMQGVELLTTGRLELPIFETGADFLKKIRNGVYTEAEVLQMAAGYENNLKHCPSVLPPSVDLNKINHWLADLYEEMWYGPSRC